MSSLGIRRAGFAGLVIVVVLGISRRADAAPITVDYVGNFIELQSGDQGLPYFLDDEPNNLRLKFFVPDYASLQAINSISVSVDLFDDGDVDDERGEVVFVLNGLGAPNLDLASFSGLNGWTSLAPLTVLGPVAGGDLADALLEIQADGFFFVRVNRRAGGQAPNSDFWVQGAAVTIDGELAAIPEPASIALLATGLAGIMVARYRRARSSSR